MTNTPTNGGAPKLHALRHCVDCERNVALKVAHPERTVLNVTMADGALFSWCPHRRCHLAILPSTDGYSCVYKPCASVELAEAMKRDYLLSVAQARVFLAAQARALATHAQELATALASDKPAH